MKKRLGLFLVLLTVVCLLGITAHAQQPLILSEDLQTLTMDDRTYSRTDLSAMDPCFISTIHYVQTPSHLQSQLKYAVAYANSNNWVISLELYYVDGSRQDIYFAYDEVRDQLLDLCQDDELVCGLTMWWEDDPSFTAPISQLKDTPTTLDSFEIAYEEYYPITHYYREMDCHIYRGMLCLYQGTYYYVDYLENNIHNPSSFYPEEYTGQLKAYEITNPKLVEQLDNTVESQYGSSDDMGQILSGMFLCFLFAVIPLGIMIPCAIFAIRSKGYYRLTWTVTAGLCAAELVIFLIVCINLLAP